MNTPVKVPIASRGSAVLAASAAGRFALSAQAGGSRPNDTPTASASSAPSERGSPPANGSAASSTTVALALAGVGSVEVTVGQRGNGRPFLLLHGGAGPNSVASFSALLSVTHGARVLTPTHPGFNGTPRPERLDSIGGLAALYAALLEQLDLHDVTVVGNSIGGWIASELALLQSPRVGRVVLVDAVGIVVEGHPVADPFSMNLDDLIARSYHNPDAFRVDPSKLPEGQRNAMAANREALAVYGGKPSIGDPTLRGRLGDVNVPTLVLWGEADRIGDPTYGRAYAAAIPQARFELLAKTGHVPQIETPEQVRAAIWDFADAHATAAATQQPDGQ